jgi:hypothetical protein
MGITPIRTRSRTYLSPTKSSKIDRHALSNVVIVPMAVPAAFDSDIPAPRAAEGRQGLDGCGDFLRVLGLEDAPGEDFLDGEAPVALEGEGVVAAWAGGEEEAGAEAGFDEGVALGG